jgi:putative membrane protein
MNMMWGMDGEWGMGFGFGMWLIPMIFIGLLVWVLSTRHRNRSGSPGEDDEDALAILKKRYAKGELSREEFETMRSDLD